MHTVGCGRQVISCVQSPGHRTKGGRTSWQTKPAAGLKSLNRAADTLSTLLAQEVKELNERQKAARRENTPDPGMMKGLKEATAVLKDLAGVVKTLNDQGTELEGTECGVVLLPPVEQEEKE